MPKDVSHKSDMDQWAKGNGCKVTVTPLGPFGNKVETFFVSEGVVRAVTQLFLPPGVTRVTEHQLGVNGSELVIEEVISDGS